MSSCPSTPVLLATGLVALLLGATIAWFTRSGGPAQDPQPFAGLLWPSPRTLQNFSLLDQSSQPFNAQRLSGKWSLLFFGFTNCPDICPNTLRMLQHATAGLPADTQVVLVSVDPERDTPEALAEYVAYFDPKFTGVTGTRAAIDAFTRQLGVVHMRSDEDDEGNYSVDHTASLFLIDPAGRLVGLFSQPLTAESVAGSYRKVREFVERQR